jgi:hypothetical protein
MRMPDPDQGIIAAKSDIVAALRAIVPGEGVIVDEDELRVYESDGLTAYRQLPLIVVLPETTDQVSRILKCCQERGVKVVPRGAGTSLSGGALPLADGIVLGLGKFNRCSRSTTTTAAPWCSRASPTSPSPTRWRIAASTTRPTRPARSPAPSAATSPRTPAACTA